LFKASGLTLRGAPKVLKVPYGTLAAYLRGADNDTTTGPPMELIERLRDIVVARAKAILNDAWADEARDPMTKEEFLRLPAQQVDFRIAYEDEHGGEPPETYPLDIAGRTGLLARVEIPRKGRALAEMRTEILEKAWETYQRNANRNVPKMSADEERLRLKARFRELESIFALKHQDVADMTGRSFGAVCAWLDPKKDNTPPEAVVRELQQLVVQRAHNLVISAGQDRALILAADGFLVMTYPMKIEGSEFSRGRPTKAAAPAT
jgi:hypothetical protein